MKQLLTFVLSLAALAFMTGGASPQKDPTDTKTPGIYDVKKYSERDLQAAVTIEMARQRSVQVFRQIAALEALHSGSVSNAITLLDGDLVEKINHLQGVLKHPEPTGNFRGPVQGTVDEYEKYRARHPRNK